MRECVGAASHGKKATFGECIRVGFGRIQNVTSGCQKKIETSDRGNEWVQGSALSRVAAGSFDVSNVMSLLLKNVMSLD